MAGPLNLDNYSIEADESNDELVITHTPTGKTTTLSEDALNAKELSVGSPGTKTIDASNYGTLQAAFDAAPQIYAEKVIIDIPDGTYTESDIQLHGTHAYGPLSEIEIRGNSSTPSNVIIDAGNNGFGLDIQYCNVAVTLNGVKVSDGNWADVLCKHVSRVNLKNVEFDLAGGDLHAGALTAVDCFVNFDENIRAGNNDNAGVFLDRCFVWNEANRDMGPEVTGLEVDNNGIHGFTAIDSIVQLEGSDRTNNDEIQIHNNDYEGVYLQSSYFSIKRGEIGGNSRQGINRTQNSFAETEDVSTGSFGDNGKQFVGSDVYKDPVDVTSSRTSGDVYQNTSTYPIVVYHKVENDGGGINTAINVGPSNSASNWSTKYDLTGSPNRHTITIKEIVPPYYYYQPVANTPSTLGTVLEQTRKL
jgi:hypothetical protein